MRGWVVGLLLCVGTATAHAGWQDRTVLVGETVREFRLFLPAFPQRNLPLVIALHGGGGNRSTMEEMANLSWFAQLYGTAVAYPEGTGEESFDTFFGTWNAGRCCGDARTDNVDDVGFLRAVITDLRRTPLIDPARVYILGHSNGAMMAYRAACEMADQVAAIATVGSLGVFDSGSGVYDQCPLVAAVPTLHIHGTEDICSPIAGGTGGECIALFLSAWLGTDVEGDPASRVDKPPLAEFFANWMAMQGYERLPWYEYPGAGAACAVYGEGLSLRAKRCVVQGMGHTWPGGKYGGPCEQLPLSRACEAWKSVVAGSADGAFLPYQGFSATRMIFDFFRRYRR